MIIKHLKDWTIFMGKKRSWNAKLKRWKLLTMLAVKYNKIYDADYLSVKLNLSFNKIFDSFHFFMLEISLHKILQK